MSRFDEVKDRLRASPRTWLVTGAAGFIGSNLVEALLDLGQLVVGLDDFSTGHRRNLDDMVRRRGRELGVFRLVEADVCSLDDCREACEGVDYVLHQAALASVPASVQDPIAAHRVNVDGTLNVLVAARDAGVRRLVYASSCAVYGNQAVLPLTEYTLGLPASPYALTKRIDEEYADIFRRTYGLEAVGLRYFNVFGARQDPRGAYAAVIPNWIRNLLAGDPCHIHGDGETSRDFCHVSNVVQANILAATAEQLPDDELVFNVGAGRRTSLNELFGLLVHGVARLGYDVTKARPVHDAFREGDIRHSQGEIRRIRSTLGYEPAAELGAQLDATVEWYAGVLAPQEVLEVA